MPVGSRGYPRCNFMIIIIVHRKNVNLYYKKRILTNRILLLLFLVNGIHRTPFDTCFHGFLIRIRGFSSGNGLAVIVDLEHIRLRRSAQAAADTGIFIYNCMHKIPSFFWFLHHCSQKRKSYTVTLFSSPGIRNRISALCHRAERPRGKSWRKRRRPPQRLKSAHRWKGQSRRPAPCSLQFS